VIDRTSHRKIEVRAMLTRQNHMATFDPATASEVEILRGGEMARRANSG
jgi:hypothetical protein